MIEVKTPNLDDNDWVLLNENPPKNGEEVYLKCEYMMFQYITKGIMSGNGKYRESSNVDADLFFRSKIVGWKSIH